MFTDGTIRERFLASVNLYTVDKPLIVMLRHSCRRSSASHAERGTNLIEVFVERYHTQLGVIRC